ncbi:histidine kinase [Chitinophaga jiangningensis]|nr:histidine kinase [Chitinophaga jiangningensis]
MKAHKEPYRYLVHLAIVMALLLLYTYRQLPAAFTGAFAARWLFIRYYLYGFINFNLFYLLVFWLINQPVKQHRYARSITIALGAAVVFSLLKYAIGMLWGHDVIIQRMITIKPANGGKPPAEYLFSFWEYFRVAFKTSMGVVILAFAYRLFLDYRNEDPLANQLAQVESNASRLSAGSQLLLLHLKALTPLLTDQVRRSEEGVQAILLISELLRYLLYDKETTQGATTLKKELYFLQQYLSLRACLYPDQTITLQVTGEEDGATAMPMQLLLQAEKLLRQRENCNGALQIAVNVENKMPVMRMYEVSGALTTIE